MSGRTLRRGPQVWARWPDERLLGLRLCDLGVRIEGTVLARRVERLHEELDTAGLGFRPYVWLSDEWHTPVGMSGFAIPFYLAHPRLVELERAMMLEAEGETPGECMKILRHEAGHTVQNAWRLGRRKRWREMFGSPAQPYADTYRPQPYSRRYVQHIDSWYAQAHPDEDFAETFAVWLTPGSNWRRRYAKWPALRKLEYVDTLMAEIADRPPLVRTRTRPDSLATLRITLAEHYEARRARYGDGEDDGDTYDRDLRRLFPAEAGEPAARVLRRLRPELRRLVSRWTGEYQYAIEQVLRAMIERCRALELRCDRDDQEVFRDASVLLTVETMSHLHTGGHRLVL